MQSNEIVIDNYVKFYRKQNNLSQAELAAMIGKTDKTISYLERCYVNATFDVCLQLARVFCLEVSDIFFEKGKAPDKKLALIKN